MPETFFARFWCGNIRGFDMAITDQTNQAFSRKANFWLLKVKFSK
jgi:hypothetical protein